MPINTSDEKIDYIFKELKSQKRYRILKTIFRLFIIGFIFFIYIKFINGIDKEQVMNNITSLVIDMVKPIIQNLVNELGNDPNLLNNLK